MAGLRTVLAILAGASLLPPSHAAAAEDEPALRGTVVSDSPGESHLTIGAEGEAALPPARRPAAVDAYAPLGIGSPALRLYPAITLEPVFSTNPGQRPRDAEAGFGLRLRPDLRLESNWTRHSLTAEVKGDMARYDDGSETGTLDIRQRLRLDVRRTTTADIVSGYRLDQPGGGDATEQAWNGGLALTHDFGPARARLSQDVELHRFSDARGPEAGDYVEPRLALRATLAEGAVLTPFVEASLSPRYRTGGGDGGDSSGYGLTAGAAVASGPVWSGELGLTYLHRNYHDGGAGSADAFGLTGALAWNPTALTRVELTATTALEESAARRGGATPTWTAAASLTHALRDNIALTAGASVEIEDVGKALETTYGANLGLSWAVNPVLSWTAGYDVGWLDAASPGEGYVEHRLSAGVTLRR